MDYEQWILDEYRRMYSCGEFEALCELFCHEGLYVVVKQDWRIMDPEEYRKQGIQIEDGSLWIAGVCSHEEEGLTRTEAIRKLANWIVAEERLGC